jgi:uncharacterized lipoprotein YddW (UPF0748 family)
MATATLTMTILLATSTAVVAGDQDSATLRVRGRGAEGRSPYRDGGLVKFLDASIGAQVVHCQDGGPMPLPLEIRYEVLEPAPILLTSRLGTEYWRLYHFGTETMAAMYADEKIDLSSPGTHTARATRAWFGTSYGPLPEAGLVGIRGHYYFLIDRPDGKWIDTTDPPAFFDEQEIGRKLTFTLADVSQFGLSIPEIQSTWQPGGPLRARLALTDAGGKVLPVVGAPVIAAGGNWRTELKTEWAPLDEPTGWMRGRLPDVVPDRVTVEAEVAVCAPKGLTERRVTASFARGDGLASADELKMAERGYELPRNSDGVVRETRAIWVSPGDITRREDVDRLIERSTQAKLNMIVPDVFVRSTFMAASDLMPTAGTVEEGFDPLGYLIEKAHAAGLEVHPWFCVTYRDGQFRRAFREKHKTGIDMLDRDGKVIEMGADVHRPEYRQFIVDLMVGVARDYQVDGIHLDYIRSMGRCYCDACRKEFADEWGKPLTEATDAEWIRWQRQAIGDIVERTADGVRQVRPGALMSAAVFANMSGGASQGQDPAGWAKSGWLDLVIPMDYRMQSLQVRADERQFLTALDDDDKLVTGLSLYMRSGGRAISRPPELVLEQIELVRRMGIHGYCLFAFSHLSDPQLQVLRDKANPQQAVPYFR